MLPYAFVSTLTVIATQAGLVMPLIIPKIPLLNAGLAGTGEGGWGSGRGGGGTRVAQAPAVKCAPGGGRAPPNPNCPKYYYQTADLPVQGGYGRGTPPAPPPLDVCLALPSFTAGMLCCRTFSHRPLILSFLAAFGEKTGVASLNSSLGPLIPSPNVVDNLFLPSC